MLNKIRESISSKFVNVPRKVKGDSRSKLISRAGSWLFFLPAAKPRRSMDGVWLPGKIKSMGDFRGQGGMVT